MTEKRGGLAADLSVAVNKMQRDEICVSGEQCAGLEMSRSEGTAQVEVFGAKNWRAGLRRCGAKRK